MGSSLVGIRGYRQYAVPMGGQTIFFAGLLHGVSCLDMCNPKKSICSTEVDEVKKQVLEHVEAWALVLKELLWMHGPLSFRFGVPCNSGLRALGVPKSILPTSRNMFFGLFGCLRLEALVSICAMSCDGPYGRRTQGRGPSEGFPASM